MGVARGWGLWWWEDLDAVPRRRKRIAIAIIILFGFCCSIALLGPLVHAKLALTDENDIPYYMGSADRVPLSAVPRLLIEKTEIGTFGEGSRFRPFYYLMRVSESALWGTDAALWYGWRIVMFAVVIATLAWLYFQFTGLVLGLILTIFTLSFQMWADIWARSTGTSEQYTSFGLAIFAIGAVFFMRRWRSGMRLRLPAVLMACGTVIAAGAKENMLILALPVAVALGAGLWRRRLDGMAAGSLVVSLLVIGWIAASLVAYFLQAKVEDMYGGTRSLGLLVSHRMIAIYAASALVALFILVLDRVAMATGGIERRSAYRRIAGLFAGAGLICGLVFVSQHVFYGGLPTRSRYDFPGILAVPFLLVLIFTALSQTLGLFLSEIWARAVTGSVLAAALITYSAAVPWRMRDAVAAQVQRTNAFDQGFRATLLRARERPDWPIVVRSYNPWDFEIVQTLGILFVAKEVRNPRFLVHSIAAQPRTAFEREALDLVLEMQSRDGVAERGYLPLTAYGPFAPSDCFVIALREPRQYLAERASGKGPEIGTSCRMLPMHIYWQDGALIFESGKVPSAPP